MLVYNDFKVVSQVLKKYKSARFKVFDSEEKAKHYAKHFYHKLKKSHNILTENANLESNLLTKNLPKPQNIDYLSANIAENLETPNKKNYKLVDISNTTRSDGEKPLPFKAPSTTQISQFRSFLNSDNVKEILNLLQLNPRLLISHGDNPVILQEGARYHALHFCARKCTYESFQICSMILKFLNDDSYYLRLYPEDGTESLGRRKEFLTDLYLNIPDKLLFETPLHMASKFGNTMIVKLLVSHPLIDKSCVNKESFTSYQVICDRYTGNDKPKVLQMIKDLLEDPYYVPVIRDDVGSVPFFITSHGMYNAEIECSQWLTNNPSPVIGKPFHFRDKMPNETSHDRQNEIQLRNNHRFHCRDHVFRESQVSSRKKIIFDQEEILLTSHFSTHLNSSNSILNNSQTNTDFSFLKIDALAGPMPYSKALEFYNVWNKTRKDSYSKKSSIKSSNMLSDKSNSSILSSCITTSLDITLKDPEKGLEIHGRSIAKSMNVPWAERWDFLNFQNFDYPSASYNDVSLYSDSISESQGSHISTTDIATNDGSQSLFNTLPEKLKLEDIASPKGLMKFENYLKHVETMIALDKSSQGDEFDKHDFLDGFSLLSSSFNSYDNEQPLLFPTKSDFKTFSDSNFIHRLLNNHEQFDTWRGSSHEDVEEKDIEEPSLNFLNSLKQIDLESQETTNNKPQVSDLDIALTDNDFKVGDALKNSSERTPREATSGDILETSLCSDFEKLSLANGIIQTAPSSTNGNDSKQCLKTTYSARSFVSPLKRRISKLLPFKLIIDDESQNTLKNRDNHMLPKCEIEFRNKTRDGSPTKKIILSTDRGSFKATIGSGISSIITSSSKRIFNSLTLNRFSTANSSPVDFKDDEPQSSSSEEAFYTPSQSPTQSLISNIPTYESSNMFMVSSTPFAGDKLSTMKPAKTMYIKGGSSPSKLDYDVFRCFNTTGDVEIDPLKFPTVFKWFQSLRRNS
ncbi:unnamed protein product [Gordionus sp. m RMFG-2023]